VSGTLIIIKFSVIVIFNQLALWMLTCWKYYRHTTNRRWPVPPLIQLVMRDNTWTFLVLTGAVAFVSLLVVER
jgi:hypothetical protein